MYMVCPVCLLSIFPHAIYHGKTWKNDNNCLFNEGFPFTTEFLIMTSFLFVFSRFSFAGGRPDYIIINIHKQYGKRLARWSRVYAVQKKREILGKWNLLYKFYSLPNIFHLCCLVAGQGQSTVRGAVQTFPIFIIISNLFRSLFVSCVLYFFIQLMVMMMGEQKRYVHIKNGVEGVESTSYIIYRYVCSKQNLNENDTVLMMILLFKSFSEGIAP